MNLTTRNGHNMYDMASMMQKAIRRNLPRYASYAAYELYGSYYTFVWRRLLVISAEDCYGIMTKEIIALKLADDEVNKNKRGYDRDTIFLAKAVMLLCMARKNRDACYVACNFMNSQDLLTEMELQNIGHVNMSELQKIILEENKIPDWVFDVHTLKGKYKFHRSEVDMIRCEQNALSPKEIGYYDDGDWDEYLSKLLSEGKVSESQIDKFQNEQKIKQKANGTEENFLKVE